MRNPFIASETGEEKEQVPFLETDHIEYTFHIIQMAAWLSCSETTLFSQVIAGISSTVYLSELSVLTCPQILDV